MKSLFHNWEVLYEYVLMGYAVAGPLLLVGGGDDILFTDSASEKILQRLCSAGACVQRNVYPGLGHDPVF
jgi:acetyl esterase/lipase